jgi:hypothetical protein
MALLGGTNDFVVGLVIAANGCLGLFSVLRQEACQRSCEC